MIKGIDIGNYATKDEKENSFISKITYTGNILGSQYNLELNDSVYIVGEGNFDTEYRKVEKENYIKLLYAMLAISTQSDNIELVLGLPISQYKQDKDTLKNIVKENFHLKGKLNGVNKEYFITDVEVYPEGIAALDYDYEGIIVDIGGLTTDCCLVNNINNRRKIDNPISLSEGTLNLYSNFINVINGRFGLDLKVKDVERIISHGLYIKGEKQNISFAIDIFKEYLENLIRELNLQYSLKTNNIVFTGGGSILLAKPIMNRLPYAGIQDNPVFNNAKGFYREGRRIWAI